MLIILQNKILHYRKPLYNFLARKYEVIVVHSGKVSVDSSDSYKEVILPSFKLGPFHLQPGFWGLLRELDPKDVDAIVVMCDFRWPISILSMYRYDAVLPWIWWGMDRGASDVIYRVKTLILKRDNPVLVYNKGIKEDLVHMGLQEGKIFVANNTFHVDSSLRSMFRQPKDIFINVGTLDKRKKNDITIKVFVELMLDLGRRDLKLVLIGDGSERDSLQSIIDSLGAGDMVSLVPTINDPLVLAKYYSRSIASVSFGQAGLAVLQSMAFGVPFVTSKDAISGGEKNNIIDGYNGFFCDSTTESFSRILRLLIEDEQLALDSSSSAFDYYSKFCTIENMASGFEDSIQFARKLR
jgi:glycosyltransferase involved in cell wall biosynthesis